MLEIKNNIYNAVILVLCIVIVGMTFYTKSLRSDNKQLNDSNSKMDLINKIQKDGLDKCDINTKALKAKEDEISQNAKVAIANSGAKNNFDNAVKIGVRQPKVITDNIIPVEAVKDYLQSKDFIDDYIASRSKVNK